MIEWQESKNEVFSKMWREMERGGPEVLLRGNQEGIDKVVSEKGSYAFFMESVTIEYLTNRNCDLRQVGTPLDSKSYGIAMPQGIYKATGKATYSEIIWSCAFLRNLNECSFSRVPLEAVHK